MLSLASGLMPAHCRKLKIYRKAQRIEGQAVLPVRSFSDLLQRNAAHPADGSGEVPVHHLPGNADSLKDLAALIGADRGYTHLGGNLDNAAQHCPVIILHSRIVILIQKPLIHQLSDGRMRKIRIYCRCAVAQQCGKMMHLAGFAGFHDQRHGRALPCLHQMPGNGRHCQKAGKRDMVFIHAPVAEDQDIRPLPVRLVHLPLQPADHPPHRRFLIIQGGNRLHPEAVFFQAPDLQKIQVRQHRIMNLQHAAVFRPLLQQISILSHIDRAGCHDHLPLRIDRRIGHLGKKLLEIIEKRLIFM